MQKPSADRVGRLYAGMLDSVSLIYLLLPLQNGDALESVARNVGHLEALLVYGDWWDGYDLAPIQAAILAAKQ